MTEIVDVNGLVDDDVGFIKKTVKLLKKKAKMKTTRKKEKIDFATWPLGVKGKLTRKEIYDNF